MTDKKELLDIASDLEKSVGLYRKAPDGRLIEIHLRQIVEIQSALRGAADIATAAEIIESLLGLELGASERAMAWLEAASRPHPHR